MGNKSSSPEIYNESLKLLSTEERLMIKKIYTEICGNNKDGFSESDLVVGECKLSTDQL